MTERAFRFPIMVNDEILGWIEEKIRERRQMREAVALYLTDQAHWLWCVTKKFLPNDEAAFIAIREFGGAGSLVLETVKDLKSGEYEGRKLERNIEKAPQEQALFLMEKAHRIQLLKLDPTACELIDWWSRSTKEFQSSPREEERAIYYGRANASGAYRGLYNVLIYQGLKIDKG